MNFLELDQLVEKAVRKKIVRNGKKQVVKRSDREGYKTVGGKEVKMSAKEKMNRQKAQKKAALKRKSKQQTSNRKRSKSMKKHTW